MPLWESLAEAAKEKKDYIILPFCSCFTCTTQKHTFLDEHIV